MYRTLLAAALVLVVTSQALAADEELQTKIKQLEDRITQLESALEPFLQQQRVAAIREQARAHMRKDLDIYSQEQLQEIEQLYQVANKKWRSEEGKTSLEKLVEKYSRANRTGCALLYLGQMSEGDEQIQYLTRAIKKYSDCYYGDGVKVGAYARYVLARRYRADGENEKADQLIKELNQDYGDAIDHRGQSLLTAIDN